MAPQCLVHRRPAGEATATLNTALNLIALLALCAAAPAAPAAAATSPPPLGDKTLVVWVSPANLTQRGGSALTIEKSGGVFSGNCFVNKEGRPTMCYHQVDQGNAMAVAVDDELNEWRKLESNPITPRDQTG